MASGGIVEAADCIHLLPMAAATVSRSAQVIANLAGAAGAGAGAAAAYRGQRLNADYWLLRHCHTALAAFPVVNSRHAHKTTVMSAAVQPLALLRAALFTQMGSLWSVCRVELPIVSRSRHRPSARLFRFSARVV